MRVKGLKPETFNNRLNRQYLLNKEILLHFAELRESEKYPETKYVHVMVEYLTDNLKGTCDLYGVLIIQKLGILDGYEPPLPLRIKLHRWWNDKQRLFNDVEILDVEAIDSYFIHNVPFGWDEDIKKAITNVETYKQSFFQEWLEFIRKDNEDEKRRNRK